MSRGLSGASRRSLPASRMGLSRSTPPLCAIGCRLLTCTCSRLRFGKMTEERWAASGASPAVATQVLSVSAEYMGSRASAQCPMFSGKAGKGKSTQRHVPRSTPAWMLWKCRLVLVSGSLPTAMLCEKGTSGLRVLYLSTSAASSTAKKRCTWNLRFHGGQGAGSDRRHVGNEVGQLA